MIAIFDYSPLWQTMREKGVSQYRLLQAGIDNKTLDSLKKNKNITMHTLEKLCRIVGCTPNEVVRLTAGTEEGGLAELPPAGGDGRDGKSGG